jgi:hypothetical protein
MNVPEHLEQEIAETGAVVRFGYPWWLRLIVFPGFRNGAVTLGRRIYVAAPEPQIPRFLRHELTHVRQIGRLGLPRFLFRYFREYVANRRSGLDSGEAYRRISFEEEAFAAEREEPI